MTSFPAGLLALVPPASRRERCICAACVRAYEADPAGFAARVAG